MPRELCPEMSKCLESTLPIKQLLFSFFWYLVKYTSLSGKVILDLKTKCSAENNEIVALTGSKNEVELCILRFFCFVFSFIL